jgi:alpha-glucosidase
MRWPKEQAGIWLWKHSRALRTPEARRKFFRICNDTGVVGAKIDFFDHEAKEIIDLNQVLLKESAQARILVEFHGSNKPAGESRTWPNEMTRESIRGLENRRMAIRARHNTMLPITRMLAGHADYSVMHFGDRRRETSWAHQIASAVIISAAGGGFVGRFSLLKIFDTMKESVIKLARATKILV